MQTVERLYCTYLYVRFGNNGKGIWDLKYFPSHVPVLDVGDTIAVLSPLKGTTLTPR